MTDNTPTQAGEKLVERLKDKWQHSEELCYEAATAILTLQSQLEEAQEARDTLLKAIHEATGDSHGLKGLRTLVAERDTALGKRERWHTYCVRVFQTYRDRLKTAESEVVKLHAALEEREGYTLVPNAALDWLFGNGPGADGFWFGEFHPGNSPTGAFWWRTHFSRMIEVARAALGKGGE